jgi:hypothetical protein
MAPTQSFNINGQFVYMFFKRNHIVAGRLFARQQIPNTGQWTNMEAMFSTRSVRQLRDAKEELLERCFLCGPRREVISSQSVESF